MEDADEQGPAIDGDVVGADATADALAPEAPLDRLRLHASLLAAQEIASRWGQEGALTPFELENPFAVRVDGHVEAFSVLDADGYEGFFKCNLFAFELAYRAGLQVPLISRSRGWSYPGPHAAACLATAQQVVGGWAELIDRWTVAQMQEASGRGEVLMVIGVGRGRRSGHMGIAELIHSVERNPRGQLRALEYTGWEANADGAHYRRRHWDLGRFRQVHVLLLEEPSLTEAQVVRIGPGPDEPSQADSARLRPLAFDAAAVPAPFPTAACRRILDDGLPRLPVAHGIMGAGSAFGPVVDVDRILGTHQER